MNNHESFTKPFDKNTQIKDGLIEYENEKKITKKEISLSLWYLEKISKAVFLDYTIDDFILQMETTNIELHNPLVQDSINSCIQELIWERKPSNDKIIIEILSKIPLIDTSERDEILLFLSRGDSFWNLVKELDLTHSKLIKKSGVIQQEISYQLKNFLSSSLRYNHDDFFIFLKEYDISENEVKEISINKLINEFKEEFLDLLNTKSKYFNEYTTMKIFHILSLIDFPIDWLSERKVKDSIRKFISKNPINEKDLDKIKNMFDLSDDKEIIQNTELPILYRNKEDYSNSFMNELARSCELLKNELFKNDIFISDVKVSPYSESIYINIKESNFYKDNFPYSEYSNDLEKNVIRISDHFQPVDNSTDNLLDILVFSSSNFIEHIDTITEEIKISLNILKNLYENEPKEKEYGYYRGAVKYIDLYK